MPTKIGGPKLPTIPQQGIAATQTQATPLTQTTQTTVTPEALPPSNTAWQQFTKTTAPTPQQASSQFQASPLRQQIALLQGQQTGQSQTINQLAQEFGISGEQLVLTEAAAVRTQSTGPQTLATQSEGLAAPLFPGSQQFTSQSTSQFAAGQSALDFGLGQSLATPLHQTSKLQGATIRLQGTHAIHDALDTLRATQTANTFQQGSVPGPAAMQQLFQTIIAPNN